MVELYLLARSHAFRYGSRNKIIPGTVPDFVKNRTINSDSVLLIIVIFEVAITPFGRRARYTAVVQLEFL